MRDLGAGEAVALAVKNFLLGPLVGAVKLLLCAVLFAWIGAWTAVAYAGLVRHHLG